MTIEQIYNAGYRDGEHDGYFSSSIEDGIEEKYYGKSFPDNYDPKYELDSTLDKLRDEIVGTLYVDSLIFGELIDFKNGKISADEVIEEFNRVTRLEVLKILDKHKAESGDEE